MPPNHGPTTPTRLGLSRHCLHVSLGASTWNPPTRRLRHPTLYMEQLLSHAQTILRYSLDKTEPTGFLLHTMAKAMWLEVGISRATISQLGQKLVLTGCSPCELGTIPATTPESMI